MQNTTEDRIVKLALFSVGVVLGHVSVRILERPTKAQRLTDEAN